MMLCQFACSLARACWWQLCKSDMSLASTAHHVAVANERHKLTLDTHTHTVTRFLHCILFSSLLTTVRDIFMLLWQFCVSRLLYIWQRTERYVIHWGPFYIYVLTAILPGETGLASLLELRMMEVVSGDNWSYKTCKAPVKSSTNKPTPSFYRPDALPVTQPTVSEHWREIYVHFCFVKLNVQWNQYFRYC